MSARLFLIALLLTGSSASAQSGAEARAAARRHREANEAKILREFSTLLSLPNVASNRDDIRRNADHLVAMISVEQVVEHRSRLDDTEQYGFRTPLLL